MRKSFISLLLAIVIVCSISVAVASDIVTYADTVIQDARISLSQSIKASFYLTAKKACGTIKISSCTLQVKSGTTWKDDCTLTVPSGTENTNMYYTLKTYASSCTSGKTYRIKAVFYADGNTATRYSNEIDY